LIVPVVSCVGVADHHRDDLAHVPRALPAERVLRRLADVEADGGGEPRGGGAEERERLQPAPEVVRGEHPHDAGHGGRRGGADRRDPRVGVR
jgi:hypothetical protein